jgi:hypothetical protein
MENDAPVVGPDAPTANSKMVKLDIATAGLESANFRFARHLTTILCWEIVSICPPTQDTT